MSLLVGAVVIAGIASFIGVYSTTRQGFQAGSGTYTVHALFDDVTGLGPRTGVTVAGVQVGEITKIELDSDNQDVARVTIEVRKDVELHEGVEQKDGRWLNGATLTRKSSSLLGDQYLELTRGLQGRRLGGGDFVRNVVTVSGLSAVMKQLESVGGVTKRLDSLFDRLDAIAGDVKKVTGTVSEALSGPEGVERLKHIADNIDKATTDITAGAKDIRALATDVKQFLSTSILGRGEEIGRIIANAERFSANAADLSATASSRATIILDDVKAVTGDIRKFISGSKGDVESSLGTLRGAIASFTGTLNRLDTALDNVGAITAKINDGKGTIGQLVNDDQVLKKVEAVVDDAGSLVKRFTSLQTRVDLTSEYYFEQQALKNYVRLRLQPKEDKYYLIELIDDPRGKTKVSTTVTQTNDPSLPPVLHETSATTSDSLKVSFLFAKRWYFLTGRFGIIEGTGGLGLDFEFLTDTLKFAFDVFDFSSDTAPRMRALANFEFAKHFYVSAGVDDVFNKAGFDWFAGIGLRFTDDDLKAFLSVAPSSLP